MTSTMTRTEPGILPLLCFSPALTFCVTVIPSNVSGLDTCSEYLKYFRNEIKGPPLTSLAPSCHNPTNPEPEHEPRVNPHEIPTFEP